MIEQETVKIVAYLGAFYGAGKTNPEVMAVAWHQILKDYDFNIAERAVFNFAKNDTRDYATFPAVGKIVQAIEEEMRKDNAPIKEVVKAVSYGWGYNQLSADAKQIISEDRYDSWLKMDAEEFSNKAGIMAETLRSERKRLAG